MDIKEREKIRETIHDNLYWEMCRCCPRAKHCHEECEECDDFTNELYKQYKAHNVNEDYEEVIEDELPPNWKSYKDENGGLHFYTSIEMLCKQLTCNNCPNWAAKCNRYKELDSCIHYLKTLRGLKKEGIK